MPGANLSPRQMHCHLTDGYDGRIDQLRFVHTSGLSPEGYCKGAGKNRPAVVTPGTREGNMQVLIVGETPLKLFGWESAKSCGHWVEL